MRNQMRRGCAYRKRGGGFSVGSPLVNQPASDFDFAVKVPVNAGYSDCSFAQRPGQLFNQPNPELAQTVMAGGASCTMKGGKRTRKHRKQRGGQCPCSMRGGSRRMRGGANGYAVDPSVSVGGDGPNVAPLHAPVPCDPRAGTHGPSLNPDPRAPADLYSLTPNQSGGAAELGNAYDDSCYRATGSSLPVYNATSAGFHFRPSTEFGSTLPDGVTAYNDVVPHAARTGGGRKNRKSRANRKNNRKGSRKNSNRR